MKNMNFYQKWHKDFFQTVTNAFPCIKGSIAEIRKPCIRPNCPACKKGDKHPAFILTFRRNGKTHCRYIAKEQVLQIRQAIANGRKIEEQMAAACEKILMDFRLKRKKKSQ